MGVFDIIKGALPFIGTALGGPLGAGAMSFVASKLGIPSDTVHQVLTAMVGDPDKINEAKKLEYDYKLHCIELGYKDVSDIERINADVVIEVNKTMQAESAAEHWPTYSWRPFIGFTFGAYINSMWILPLFHMQPVVMDPGLVLAIGGILGVASYFRGKAQADPDVMTPIVGAKG